LSVSALRECHSHERAVLFRNFEEELLLGAFRRRETALKSRFIARLSLTACAALGLALLSGCDNQKVIARVKDQAITEKQIAERALRLTATDLQSVGNLDAGGAALLSTIREKLSDIYCSEKGYQPAKEEVDKYVAYVRRRNPPLDAALQEGKIDPADLQREQKFLMQEVAIGTDGAKVTKEELQKEYNDTKTLLSVPKFYVIRLLPLPDAAAMPPGVTADKVLAELKNSGDWRTAAAKLGMPPQQAITSDQKRFLSQAAFDAATAAELDKLTPGKFTDKPIKIQFNSDPANPQAGQSAMIIGQMDSVIPAYTPTLDEVTFVLTQRILARKFQDFERHKNQVIAEYTSKANIQINSKRYEPLLDVFRLQAQLNAAPPTGTPMIQGGAPQGGAATAPPSGGTTPAPSGSGTAPVPSSGTSAPSGATGAGAAPTTGGN
jgi:hypothetical protein